MIAAVSSVGALIKWEKTVFKKKVRLNEGMDYCDSFNIDSTALLVTALEKWRLLLRTITASKKLEIKFLLFPSLFLNLSSPYDLRKCVSKISYEKGYILSVLFIILISNTLCWDSGPYMLLRQLLFLRMSGPPDIRSNWIWPYHFSSSC